VNFPAKAQRRKEKRARQFGRTALRLCAFAGKLYLLICLIVLNVLRAPVAAQQAEPIYDVVIRNGRVLDGAGNPWILADVAIKDGRFARIGKVLERGRQEIDATGRYVSPGVRSSMVQAAYSKNKSGRGRAALAPFLTCSFLT
jgi:hypothetical protein